MLFSTSLHKSEKKLPFTLLCFVCVACWEIGRNLRGWSGFFCKLFFEQPTITTIQNILMFQDFILFQSENREVGQHL